MLAVFKHELRQYFGGMTAYVFGGFLLFFIGLYTMIYNLKSAIANFEYVLASVCLVFVVLIPILTMRSISEEKRQKTDQLLYSLPLSMSQIIIGKFLALFVVFLMPMLLVCFYPVILHNYGDVYLPLSFGSIIAFVFLGGALIAVGMFVSSLTESQALAAGICFVALVLNYNIVSLSESASSSALGTLIFLLVVLILLVIVIYVLTKSRILALSTLFIGVVGLLLFYLFCSSYLQNMLPSMMEEISLFEKYYVFVNGVFDLTGIVYFLSVTIFFLFLSVQVMEKRRYN